MKIWDPGNVPVFPYFNDHFNSHPHFFLYLFSFYLYTHQRVSEREGAKVKWKFQMRNDEVARVWNLASLGREE